ncbi:MAG: hypothetical protein Tsb009_36170 [Planctomycetaceae bacterium]
MPTYDYECQACEHQWELFQSIKAKPIRKCPSCGKLKAKRMIGPGAGIIFKGSGFYQTDYRSDSYNKAAAADKKSQESSESKSTSDSKASSDSTSKNANNSSD